MKLKKTKKKNRTIKFHQIGNEVYSVVKIDDDLFLRTDTYYVEKHRFHKTKINQGSTLLEINAPLMYLFNKVLSLNVVKEDKEFPDMTTYETINNKELRKELKGMYYDVLIGQIDELNKEFNEWKENFIFENSAILPKEQIDKIIKSNENALEENINNFKYQHKISDPKFDLPRITESKDLYTLEQLNRFDYLTTIKNSESFRVSYFYDLDQFSTINIYKVKTIRGTIKSVETFIYNREIIAKFCDCVEKYNL